MSLPDRLQMAGHELFHQAQQESLELYEWFSTQANRYLRTGAEPMVGADSPQPEPRSRNLGA